ncbi:MAG: hypothetical protein JAY66_25635 [Candidatus Thiodiazotropha taylori]|nr:hypothetical protein [Candidatus Thiodiazotropha taylori]
MVVLKLFIMADQQAQQQAHMQQQAQAQAPDVQFVHVLGNLGEQVAGLSTSMGAQGVAKIVPSFDGDCKKFKEWIKSIEKYCVLTHVPNDQVKMIAYQSSKGPVSDFLKRHLETHPDHNWMAIKAELTSRFAEVTDPQHALMLLRKVKQKPGENIQVYAERLMALSEDAFFGQLGDAVQTQLVGFFIDGLAFDYMKMKVMRENPATLQAAITVATAEHNLRKRFDLRTSSHSGQKQNAYTGEYGTEPMEVDHARPKLRCFVCNKKGHKAKDCRSRQHNVNSVRSSSGTQSSTLRCWNCNKLGHIARRCRAKRNTPNNTGNRPSQAQAQEN